MIHQTYMVVSFVLRLHIAPRNRMKPTTNNIHDTLNHLASAKLRENPCIRDKKDLQSSQNGMCGRGETKHFSTRTNAR